MLHDFGVGPLALSSWAPQAGVHHSQCWQTKAAPIWQSCRLQLGRSGHHTCASCVVCQHLHLRKFAMPKHFLTCRPSYLEIVNGHQESPLKHNMLRVVLQPLLYQDRKPRCNSKIEQTQVPQAFSPRQVNSSVLYCISKRHANITCR